MINKNTPTTSTNFALSNSIDPYIASTAIKWEKYPNLGAWFGAKIQKDHLRTPDKADTQEKQSCHWFSPAHFSPAHRCAKNALEATAIVLDLDAGTPDIFKRIYEAYSGYEYVAYTTWSHTIDKPAMRLIFPFYETIQISHYSLYVRFLCSILGMDYFDKGSLEMCRAFFYPQCPRENAPSYQAHLNTPEEPHHIPTMLTLSNIEEHNPDTWPKFAKEYKEPTALGIMVASQDYPDPRKKGGLVGKFCRAFSVYDILEHELSNVWLPTHNPQIYKHINGKGLPGGKVMNDGAHFISYHQNSDPHAGHLFNAFDLIKHYHFDTEPTDEDRQAQAYGFAKERLARLKEEKKDTKAPKDPKAPHPLYSDEEINLLKQDIDEHLDEFRGTKTEKRLETLTQIIKLGLPKIYAQPLKSLLRKNAITDLIEYNTHLFQGTECEPPKAEVGEWCHFDESANFNFLTYVLIKRLKECAKSDQCFEAIRSITSNPTLHFNPVKEKLTAIKWDNIPRIETALFDYLKAPDDPLTRTISKNFFIGAVSRIMEPGFDFPYMLVVCGKPGVGKSEFFRNLIGKAYYSIIPSDAKTPKLRCEATQYSLIVEDAELNYYNARGVDLFKSDIETPIDIFRAPYARTSTIRKRRNVWVGTSNNMEIVKDTLNERRLWAVACGLEEQRELPREKLKETLPQLWAEALYHYHKKTPIHLPKSLWEDYKKSVERHKAQHWFTEYVEDFLEEYIDAKDYYQKPKGSLYSTWETNRNAPFDTIEKRGKVSLEEIINEIPEIKDTGRSALDSTKKRKIVTDIMNGLPHWEKSKNPVRFGTRYGQKKGVWKRKEEHHEHIT